MLKWYESIDVEENGTHYWWTQRNKNGVFFEIRRRFAMFSLLVCGKIYGRYFSLDQAMKEAEKYNANS